MSIEKIKSNKEVFSGRNLLDTKSVKNRAYLTTPQDSVSFTGATAQASKTLQDFLLDLMPKSIRGMVKIHEGMGEFQNQLINAVGTGLVAPVFIKWNPLSDKDEDTRTYTAWRQPVSAVLAIGTQGAIVIPFNRLIKKLSDVGYFGPQYNATLFPSDTYIEKQIKRENPSTKYTKKELAAAIKTRKEDYDKKFISMIEQDKIVFNTTDGKTATTLEMPKADFKKLFEETLDSIIKDESQQKLVAIQKKLPKKIERGIFLHNYPEETTEILQRLQGKISQTINQTDFLNGSNATADATSTHKLFNAECKTIIKELKKEIKKDSSKRELNTELIKIVKEIQAKSTGSDTAALGIIDAKITKILENIEIMRAKSSTKEIIDYVTESITRRTNAIDETIETLTKIKSKLLDSGITVKEAQEIINETIRRSNDAVRSQLQASGNTTSIHRTSEWIESVGTRLSEKVKSIARCIAEQQKKHVKSNIDGMKRWTGLGVSLAILPFTCWMLNKIYPWFMDRAFPELSNKAASAKKDKNEKAGEVK